MNVLVVTNMYPTTEHPMLGTFVKTQVDSLKDEGLLMDVLFINGVASRWNYLKGFLELHTHLRSRRYDLIHAHYGLTGFVARLQGNCPLVVSFSGDDVFGTPKAGGRYSIFSRMIARASRVLVECADAVIVKSQAMKRYFRPFLDRACELSWHRVSFWSHTLTRGTHVPTHNDFRTD